MSSQLTTIVTWRNRNELQRALPFLVDASERARGDLIIVNYGGDPAGLRTQIGQLAKRLWIVDVEPTTYFNKSSAQNIGASHTTSNTLFFCDCDIEIPPDLLCELTDLVNGAERRFATLARVRETELNSRNANNIVCFGYHLKLKTKDGTQLEIVDNEEDATDGSRQAPGLLMVRRPDFDAINGYNNGLQGWGWEDQDMICRLTLGAKLQRMSHGSALHISHDDDARMKNYFISDRWESRDRMFRSALANYDNANFNGTYREDRTRLKSIKVRGDLF